MRSLITIAFILYSSLMLSQGFCIGGKGRFIGQVPTGDSLFEYNSFYGCSSRAKLMKEYNYYDQYTVEEITLVSTKGDITDSLFLDYDDFLKNFPENEFSNLVPSHVKMIFTSSMNNNHSISIQAQGRLMLRELKTEHLGDYKSNSNNYWLYKWDYLSHKFKLIDKNEFSNITESQVYSAMYSFDQDSIEDFLRKAKAIELGGGGYDRPMFKFDLMNSRKIVNYFYDQSIKYFNSGEIEKAGVTVKKIIEIEGLDLNALLKSDSSYIQKISDFGYFLSQIDDFFVAKGLFDLMLEYDPKREVTYLNYADAQYKLQNPKVKLQDSFKQEELLKAKQNYLKYIDLMKQRGLTHKIPKYVFDRIN